MTELLKLTAVVEAPPERVAEILLAVRPDGEAGGEPGDEPGDKFVITDRGSRITVTIDRAARSVSRQGEWWYRGVTSVEPEPRGSLVVHRIYNVAETSGWAVRFVARRPLNEAPESFAATVRG
ncbi:hypothetical protein, partial [Paractinoplanes toevensis]|uniref:hypothetical protein n=1 Tax=Paractinoplanes toevensis TaxID=571911 RepID=UPI001BB42197